MDDPDRTEHLPAEDRPTEVDGWALGEEPTVVGPPGPPPPPGPPVPPEEGRDLDRALAIGLTVFLVLVAAGIATAILLTRHGKSHANGRTRPAPTAPLATTGSTGGSTRSGTTRSSRTVGGVVRAPAATTAASRPTTAPKVVPPPPVTVPDLVGETRLAALTQLRRAGLGKRVHLVPAGNEQPGIVIAQFPKAGVVLPRGRPVRINVAHGRSTGGGTTPPRTTPTTTSPSTTSSETDVPDVTSLDERQATSDLQDAGFQVDSTDRAVTDQSEDGTVLDQRPAGGTSAPDGSTVTIVVGRFTG